MKFLALAIGLTLTAQTLSAGMFSAVSGMGMKEIKAQQEYTVDTAGINPRVYEFTPQGAPEKYCILVVLTGDQPSSTLQCFDKKEM